MMDQKGGEEGNMRAHRRKSGLGSKRKGEKTAKLLETPCEKSRTTTTLWRNITQKGTSGRKGKVMKICKKK